MTEQLSIFDIENNWLKNDIYAHGLKEEIKEITKNFGSSSELAKLLAVDYNSCFKEWIIGRNPIPRSKFEKMISFCENNFQTQIKNKINSKEIFVGCKKSANKMKFPNNISNDLAYCIGLILGDGSLAGDNRNQHGSWTTEVFFDNQEHQKEYNKIIKNIFGINTKYRRDKENCHSSAINSKAFYWFIRSYFEIDNGFKASKIKIPKRILNSENKQLICSCLQGLFDSDGTITKRNEIRFSSASKQIVDEIKVILQELKINCHINKWVKAERFLPLYTIYFGSKESVLIFAQHIGFRHPNKKAKLEKFVNSPVV